MQEKLRKWTGPFCSIIHRGWKPVGIEVRNWGNFCKKGINNKSLNPTLDPVHKTFCCFVHFISKCPTSEFEKLIDFFSNKTQHLFVSPNLCFLHEYDERFVVCLMFYYVGLQLLLSFWSMFIRLSICPTVRCMTRVLSLIIENESMTGNALPKFLSRLWQRQLTFADKSVSSSMWSSRCFDDPL